jgi:hypothetical protein
MPAAIANLLSLIAVISAPLFHCLRSDKMQAGRHICDAENK